VAIPALVSFQLFTGCGSSKDESPDEESLVEIENNSQESAQNLESPDHELFGLEKFDSDKIVMDYQNNEHTRIIVGETETNDLASNISRDFGYGYNEINDVWCGKCIEGDIKRDSLNQFSKGKISLIENYSELSKYSKGKVGGSFNIGPIIIDGGHRGSTGRTYNKLARYLLIELEVKTATIFLENQSLSRLAIENISKGGYKNFVRTCGTKYLSRKSEGGKIYALIEISSSSEGNSKSNKTTLEAVVGDFASLGGGFKNKITSLAKNSTLKIEVFKSGGNGYVTTDIDKLIIDINSFPKEVRNNPAVFFEDFDNYNGISGYPNRYKRTQVGWVAGRIDEVSKYLDSAISYEADLNLVKRYPSAFTTDLQQIIDTLYRANEKQKEKYKSFIEKLKYDFYDKGKLNAFEYKLPAAPIIVDIKSLPGWTVPYVEKYVKTHLRSITTNNRREVRYNSSCKCEILNSEWCLDRYTNTIVVGNHRNYLTNARIICQKGSCDLNRKYIEKSFWITEDGKRMNWDFCAGYDRTYFDIAVDEVERIYITE